MKTNSKQGIIYILSSLFFVFRFIRRWFRIAFFSLPLSAYSVFLCYVISIKMHNFKVLPYQGAARHSPLTHTKWCASQRHRTVMKPKKKKKKNGDRNGGSERVWIKMNWALNTSRRRETASQRWLKLRKRTNEKLHSFWIVQFSAWRCQARTHFLWYFLFK